MISLVRKPRNRVADVNSAPVDLLANGSDKDEASNDRVHEIQISTETASNGAASVIGSSRSALGLFQDASDTDSEIGNTKEQEEINAVVKQVLKGEGRAQNMVKLMALMSVPFIALITMSTITLVQVFTRFLNTKQVAGTVQWFLQVDSLIASLQVERGLSATYVTAGDNAFSTIQTLWQRYNATNHYIWSLSHWPDEFTYRGRSIADRQQFVELLREIRGRVAASRLSFDESTRIYTAINTQLMDIATYSVLTADRMWPYLVSASAMLRASDAMGIQRALGSSFFLLCRLRSDVYEWFMQLDGEVRSLQGMSFVYHPDIEQKWGDLLNRTLQERLISLKSRIYSTEFSSQCENSSAEARANTSATWFDSMTVYISQWKAIRMHLLDDIMEFIADDMSASQKEVVIYTICIGITLITFLLALTFSVNYAKNMKKLTSKIAEFAEQMALKSVELSREKKRTDLLLYQMLPKSVADQLRAKKEVLPQFFDHVTIYFSDIVGFTVICAKSTPMEVVAMLNGIYSAFDSSIDRYEVYKVETIGDAYMVVSGLPKPNPRHTREICLMALDLRQCLKGLRIPHLPEENFNLRIGIHTGSCVAGIVGLKMPRYCLFGDTVNTASRMESTGEAHKIHISDAVRKELEKEVGFRVLERGEIFVKGKGNMKTFWLLDYKDQYSP